jgi:hypothetical protein
MSDQVSTNEKEKENSASISPDMFYKETRDHIKHEDMLINNRMTWLIGLQAFLFGAYGFSLSAQSTVESARVSLSLAKDVSDSALNLELTNSLTIISTARLGFALTGICSALALFVGIVAASFSMGSLVKVRNEKYPKECQQYPQIMGNTKIFRTVGKYAGLSPALTLPWVCIYVWGVLGVLEDKIDLLKYIEIATILVFCLWIIIYLAFKVGRWVEAKYK